MSAGEKEWLREVKEVDEGAWRLRSFDLNFRLILCGIKVGIAGDHEKPNLGLVNVSCRPPSRCVAMLVLTDIVGSCRSSTPKPITHTFPPVFLSGFLPWYASLIGQNDEES